MRSGYPALLQARRQESQVRKSIACSFAGLIGCIFVAGTWNGGLQNGQSIFDQLPREASSKHPGVRVPNTVPVTAADVHPRAEVASSKIPRPVNPLNKKNLANYQRRRDKPMAPSRKCEAYAQQRIVS